MLYNKMHAKACIFVVRLAALIYILIDIKQGQALLFCRSNLKRMPFNSQGTGDFIPYADSDVRNFLVNDFEKNAFSPDELKSIIRKTIECTVYCFDETKRDGFHTVSKKEEIRVANKTSSDRVFLLSVIATTSPT